MRFNLKKSYRIGIGLLAFYVIGRLCLPSSGVKPNENSNDPGSATTSPKEANFIAQSCADVLKTFGENSKLSDLQKEELWSKFEDKPFEWNLRVFEVSSTGDDFAVEYGCSAGAKGQTLVVYYPPESKGAVMKLRKGRVYKVTGRLRTPPGLLLSFYTGLPLDQIEPIEITNQNQNDSKPRAPTSNFENGSDTIL